MKRGNVRSRTYGRRIRAYASTMINAIAITIGLAFSADAPAQSMSKAEYKSARDDIAAQYKSAKATCAPFSGARKDGSRGKIKRQICEAEAKGKRDVARAELEARYSPSTKNTDAVNTAKVKADYSVAKERCAEADHVKLVCLEEAKAVQTRAMAAAKENPAVSTSKP